MTTSLRISSFDSSPFGFPKPYVPALPNRAAKTAHDGQTSAAPLLIKSDIRAKCRSYMRGRYALGKAYRLSGTGLGTTLMAPAYHCITMLDPAVELNADILLYPLNSDLSPDLDALDTLYESAASPVKALLATHYFGFIQPFDVLKNWCLKRNITLIEDCSHVLFGDKYQASGAGKFGELVVSSPYKFFACEDGGLLYTQDAAWLVNVRTVGRTLVDELRGIKHTIERRLFEVSESALPGKQEFLDEAKTRAALSVGFYTRPSSNYEPNSQDKAALRFSRWMVKNESPHSIAVARRANYTHWLEAVTALPNCESLYPRLPDTCIPYMFPLVIEHPQPHFHWLKQLGMPIWRWDELAISNCAISKRYQLHLLHLPCHQALSTKQMEWMIYQLGEVIRNPTTGGSHGLGTP